MLDARVVWLQLGIGEWPILTDAILRAGAEIRFVKPWGDGHVDERRAPDSLGSDVVEVACRGIQVSSRILRIEDLTSDHFEVRAIREVVDVRDVSPATFQYDDVEARFAELLGNDAPSGARADHYDVNAFFLGLQVRHCGLYRSRSVRVGSCPNAIPCTLRLWRTAQVRVSTGHRRSVVPQPLPALGTRVEESRDIGDRHAPQLDRRERAAPLVLEDFQ